MTADQYVVGFVGMAVRRSALASWGRCCPTLARLVMAGVPGAIALTGHTATTRA